MNISLHVVKHLPMEARNLGISPLQSPLFMSWIHFNTSFPFEVTLLSIIIIIHYSPLLTIISTSNMLPGLLFVPQKPWCHGHAHGAQDTLPAYLPLAGGVRPVGFTRGPSSNSTQATIRCEPHQNHWDLWMFIPLKMVYIYIL